MILGHQIRNRCNLLGITLTRLSKISGVPKATLHGWTVGRKPRDLCQVEKVASVLGLQFYEIIFGASDSNSSNKTFF